MAIAEISVFGGTGFVGSRFCSISTRKCIKIARSWCGKPPHTPDSEKNGFDPNNTKVTTVRKNLKIRVFSWILNFARCTEGADVGEVSRKN